MTDTPITDLDRQELDVLLRGFQVSRMLRLIADLGVPDKVPTDGQLTAQELSAACGVQADPLLRVLRALAAFGVFAQRSRVPRAVRSSRLVFAPCHSNVSPVSIIEAALKAKPS